MVITIICRSNLVHVLVFHIFTKYVLLIFSLFYHIFFSFFYFSSSTDCSFVRNTGMYMYIQIKSLKTAYLTLNYKFGIEKLSKMFDWSGCQNNHVNSICNKIFNCLEFEVADMRLLFKRIWDQIFLFFRENTN